MFTWRTLWILACFALVGADWAAAQPAAESRNMVLVGHNDLNGNGDGGEGLALQQFPDGRKVLYLAHEAPARCLSVIDVTRPEAPVMVNQLPSPAPGVTRCNSLGLSGTVLAVANQAAKAGGTLAGMWVLDVSSFDRVQGPRSSLDDLKLSFFDTSGPQSRGVHNLWFVDGEFAHLTTGMPDFNPTNEQDDQIWVTVDLRDPRRPREVGRWWLPGTRQGDRCLPGCLPKRHTPFDDGYRPHQIEIWPDHADRAYVAYIDGGAMIFDISGLAQVREGGRAQRYTPRLVGAGQFHPPFPAWTHTFQPMFSRKLAWASDEDMMDNCKDAPKLVWLLDIRDETNPVIVATAPLHAERRRAVQARAAASARTTSIRTFPVRSTPTLQNTTVTTWFNGGVRIYRATEGPKGVADVPPQIEELGFYIPAAPPRNPSKTIQINHAIVGADGFIYANDRFAGGLYILRYTGTVPLD